MRTRCAFGLFVALAAAAPVAAQKPDDPLAKLPNPSLTKQKTEALTGGLDKLKKLGEQLEKLGSPAKKLPDEDTPAYLLRVDRILKGRALYIHLLHQQIQTTLEARYELEAYLDDYKAWSETLSSEIQKQLEKHRQRARTLELRVEEAKKDILVLANHLAAKAEDAETKKAMADIVDKELLGQVTDAATREAKFAQKSVEDKKLDLDRLIKEVKDGLFEIDVIDRSVLPETTELAGILPPEHEKAVKLLETTLTKNKAELSGLEEEAVKLSILAKYAGDGLKMARPDPAGTSNPLLPQIQAQEKDIQVALKGYQQLTGRTPGAAEATDVKSLLRAKPKSSTSTPNPAPKK